MPRLRHKVTGVVVVVDEATAAGLGYQWEALEEPIKADEADAPAAKPTKARRTLK